MAKGVITLASGGNCSEEHTTTGILVVPSAGSWAVVLTDSSGRTVFQASATSDDTYYAPVQVKANAFNMTTATNITSVLIYT